MMARWNKVYDLIEKTINFILTILISIILFFVSNHFIQIISILKNSKLSEDVLINKPKDENIDYQIIKLKNINKDICGWIEITNTNIDYPLVQGKSNEEYLNLNYKKEYSTSGSIFIDTRCNKNFENIYTIIYGHNMRDNSMFGDVNAYKKESFFKNHLKRIIYSENTKYLIEIFAIGNINCYSNEIYNVSLYKDDNTNLIQYIKNNSINFENINIKPTDKIIALSTCTNDSNIRAVLFARIDKV